MSDDADRAQIEIERELEYQLQKIVEAARESAVSTTECERSGIEKPPARHYKKYCIDCQVFYEKKAKGL